jgi:hypothetical protein
MCNKLYRSLGPGKARIGQIEEIQSGGEEKEVLGGSSSGSGGVGSRGKLDTLTHSSSAAPLVGIGPAVPTSGVVGDMRGIGISLEDFFESNEGDGDHVDGGENEHDKGAHTADTSILTDIARQIAEQEGKAIIASKNEKRKDKQIRKSVGKIEGKKPTPSPFGQFTEPEDQDAIDTDADDRYGVLHGSNRI